jgi:Holliday junction resolvase RusA-like endonuclease
MKPTSPLVLRVPPTANFWWRNVGGRMVKSKEAREYQSYAYTTALAAGYRPIHRPQEVAVSIVWHRQAAQGDLDKRLGVLLDALQGACYEKDSQVAELHAVRITGCNEDCMEVGVTPLGFISEAKVACLTRGIR